MKLKYQFVIREVAGQHVAVAVGQDNGSFNGMVKLNATGAYLMGLLNSRQYSREELVEALLAKYDVDRERAVSTLDAFLNTLRQGELLSE